MTAAQALAGIGPADLGDQANEFRALMRRRVERGTGERLGGPAILAHGTPRQAFLTSRPGTIWGGTAEIQRSIIAGRLFGLPEEPRSRA